MSNLRELNLSKNNLGKNDIADWRWLLAPQVEAYLDIFLLTPWLHIIFGISCSFFVSNSPYISISLDRKK